MPALKVTFRKLEKYADLHGGYEILKDNGMITLTFVPAFPEALEKGDSSPPPRVIMTGVVSEDGILQFNQVQIEDSRGIRERDADEAALVYGSWLQYIEDNY